MPLLTSAQVLIPLALTSVTAWALVPLGSQEGTASPESQFEEPKGLTLMETGSASSLRGLCAVSADVAWATGSDAAVLRTVDGGATWKNVAPESIAGLDVRDVAAWSKDTAWIMTAGPAEASRILTTTDGGATWIERHRETAAEAFLDGIDVWDEKRGMAYGDPMPDGRFRVLVTEDAGATWIPLTTGPKPMQDGEASFAASGTGIRVHEGGMAWIATGANDAKGRVFRTTDHGASWTASETTIQAKKPASGTFSITFASDGTGVAVGGDFTNRELGGTACASWTEDFGVTWNACTKGPRGQRAGSTVRKNGEFLATGQTGTDISRDGGRTWLPFSREGFHCVDVAASDGSIWFAGPRGRIARLK